MRFNRPQKNLETSWDIWSQSAGQEADIEHLIEMWKSGLDRNLQVTSSLLQRIYHDIRVLNIQNTVKITKAIFDTIGIQMVQSCHLY